jgi:GT2 family glycosyltransferase
MKFTLIICTYNRPKPLLQLLQSVQEQTLYPSEILIIDGSENNETAIVVKQNVFKKLDYFVVSPTDRGLTRQRNFGIERVANDSEIICFLDDDTILEHNYFEQIIETYAQFPEALGVGGYIINEDNWKKITKDDVPNIHEFYYDGWKKADGSRFVLRKRLGLDSNVKPGFLPEFSHGRSIGFIPPSGKIYQVEQLMGGVSSFKKSVFKTFQFSTYFKGYGLYEDADFTLRLSKTGKLYINTNAQLSHYHDPSGRPNQYRYGKMVVRNGWYIWRIKYPNPSLKARIKWHCITLLLALIRFTNAFTTPRKKEAFSDFSGRIVGWIGLWFRNPK